MLLLYILNFISHGQSNVYGFYYAEKGGVTELEAINILNGRCVTDYVEKYQRIKNLIPLKVDKKKKAKDMEENV